MGGSIEFRSEYGNGTTFKFSIKDRENPIPAVSNNYANAESPDELEESKISPLNCSDCKRPLMAGPSKSEIALVVDDEDICAHVLKEMLEKLGVSAEKVYII